MAKELHIILVEDNVTNQKRMTEFLHELFPCVVTSFTQGVAALNFLLAPTSQYDLVILDGRLRSSLPRTLAAVPIDGPEVAETLKDNGIKAKVVLWTSEPSMLERFDEIYGERLPEIEKPCRKTNVQAVLTSIVDSIISSDDTLSDTIPKISPSVR